MRGDANMSYNGHMTTGTRQPGIDCYNRRMSGSGGLYG